MVTEVQTGHTRPSVLRVADEQRLASVTLRSLVTEKTGMVYLERTRHNFFASNKNFRPEKVYKSIYKDKKVT